VKAVLYLVAVFVTVPLTVMVALVLVGMGLRQGVFRQEDLSFILGLALTGAIVFWAANRLLNRKPKAPPTLRTHFVQSSLIYAVLAISIVWLALNTADSSGLDFALLAVLAGASAYAIAWNAVFLHLRRDSSTNPGKP
jgi:hypothetical protein